MENPGPRLDIDFFDMHAAFCSVFSSPVRLRIMWLLADGEKTVSAIAQALDLAIPNVSQHIRLMRDQGAVTSRREGRTISYRIANPKFLTGARLIREGLMEEWRKRGSMFAAGPHYDEIIPERHQKTRR